MDFGPTLGTMKKVKRFQYSGSIPPFADLCRPHSAFGLVLYAWCFPHTPLPISPHRGDDILMADHRVREMLDFMYLKRENTGAF